MKRFRYLANLVPSVALALIGAAMWRSPALTRDHDAAFADHLDRWRDYLTEVELGKQELNGVKGGEVLGRLVDLAVAEHELASAATSGLSGLGLAILLLTAIQVALVHRLLRLSQHSPATGNNAPGVAGAGVVGRSVGRSHEAHSKAGKVDD